MVRLLCVMVLQSCLLYTSGDGSDWFVGQVLDNVSGEQVAVLRHQYDEDTFSRQIYCLGRWYNLSLIHILF